MNAFNPNDASAWNYCCCGCHKQNGHLEGDQLPIMHRADCSCCNRCPICQENISGNLEKHKEEVHQGKNVPQEQGVIVCMH